MTDVATGGAVPSPAGAAPEPPGSAVDPGVPKELWKIGLGFSVFLILAGLAVMAFYDQLFSIGALAVCIGFGVALTTFGTRTGGTFLTFNVVGGGAMAIALYLLIFNFPLAGGKAKYLFGEIYQTGKLKDVRGRAKHVFLTGRTQEEGDFRFVVLENEIGNAVVRFSFDYLNDRGEEREFFINCISAQDFRAAIDSRETLSLSLEGDAEGKFRLVDRSNNREIGRLNVQDWDCKAPATDSNKSEEVGSLDWFSIAAYAQESTAVDIPKAIALLESDDGDLRDRAREQIASLREPNDYSIVAGSWNISESSYRADLGRLVAWSAAIGQDRATAVKLANALSPDQLSYLVQLTGQGDITLRQFATEVLHRLLETTSWPGGPPSERANEIIVSTLAALALPESKLKTLPKKDVQFSPANLLYNTVVAIGFTECNIGKPYRPAVVKTLSELATQLGSAGDSPKTAAKVAKVLSTLNGCP